MTLTTEHQSFLVCFHILLIFVENTLEISGNGLWCSKKYFMTHFLVSIHHWTKLTCTRTKTNPNKPAPDSKGNMNITIAMTTRPHQLKIKTRSCFKKDYLKIKTRTIFYFSNSIMDLSSSKHGCLALYRRLALSGVFRCSNYWTKPWMYSLLCLQLIWMNYFGPLLSQCSHFHPPWSIQLSVNLMCAHLTSIHTAIWLFFFFSHWIPSLLSTRGQFSYSVLPEDTTTAVTLYSTGEGLPHCATLWMMHSYWYTRKAQFHCFIQVDFTMHNVFSPESTLQHGHIQWWRK